MENNEVIVDENLKNDNVQEENNEQQKKDKK